MPIGTNLIAAWNFGGADPYVDKVGGTTTLVATGATISGGGVLCDANDERAVVVAPAGLRPTGDMTIAVLYDLLGTPTDAAGICGINYDDANNNPHHVASIDINVGTFRQMGNTGGTVFSSASGGTPATANDLNLISTFTGARWDTWLGGSSIIADIATRGARGYGASSQIFVGAAYAAQTRNPNVRIKRFYIWDADKTADVAAFAADPTGSTWAPWSAPSGPTIDTQPQADTVLINGDASRASASFTVAATTSGGTLTYQWELETSVGGGTYANVANGSGATWAGATTTNLTGTFTVKTLTGRRVRCVVTDSNGSTTTNAVALTVYTGPVLSSASGTTNGSGVSTTSITSDYPNADGEFTVVTATAGAVTKQVSLHYETP